MANDALPEGTYCGRCRRRLDGVSDAAPSRSRPCPVCGALNRLISVHETATVQTYSSLHTKVKSPPGTRRGLSSKRTFLETWIGDDYHRDTGLWNRLERVIDRARNWYYEHITARDGTVIVHQEHALTEHQGRGSAKHKEPPRS